MTGRGTNTGHVPADEMDDDAMRVLICPQRFLGTLTAVQAAEAIAEGWRSRAPHDQLIVAPFAGGGAGFLDVLAQATDGGLTVATTVSDPLGQVVPAAVLLVESGGVRTAFIEAAQACGLHLVQGPRQNPLTSSSYGVGQLIEVACSEGAQRIVVAVGDAATNDGGAGMLAALGAGAPEHLARGGAALADLPVGAAPNLASVRERLAGVELVLATGEDLPLLGLQGASAAMAGARGATPEQAQQLERSLARWRHIVDESLAAPLDLLTGLPRRFDREPGAGAGGGLGYGLLLLGARRQGAVQWCSDAWNLPDLLSRTDLVVTGEGCLDVRSFAGGVVAEVSGQAASRGLPVVVIAGQVRLGRRDTMGLGLAGTYAVADSSAEIAAAMADPVGTLTDRAARIAGTWSPG